MGYTSTWPRIELCARRIKILRSHISTTVGGGWRGIFKGISQDGGPAKFPENLQASPFIEGLPYRLITHLFRSALNNNFKKFLKMLSGTAQINK